MNRVKIILADINDVSETKHSLSQIAPCYLKKYYQHKIKEDAKQELVSGLLLKRYFGICRDEQLFYNEYEKPFLASKNGFFNLSHSGNYVALAIADCDVGIDVERIRLCHDATVKKVFHPTYKAEVKQLDGEEKNEAFTRIWTKYEAVLKLRGIGFGEGWEKEAINNYVTHTIRFDDFFLTCATKVETSIEVERI